MPSYASVFTPRYRLKYLQGGMEHALQFRGERDTSFETMETIFNELATTIFTALATPRCDDTVFISASIALTDSNLFVPTTELPEPPSTGGQNVADVSPYMRAHGLTFAGAAPGSRARFTIFGLFFDVTDPANPAANGLITSVGASMISDVADAASGAARAGSGQAATFYHRATYKVNDHLLALIRRATL